MTKEAILNNVDFKELAKSCKSTDDISKITKEFIENMLKAEIEEFVENKENSSKNDYYSKRVRSESGEIELNLKGDKIVFS